MAKDPVNIGYLEAPRWHSYTVNVCPFLNETRCIRNLFCNNNIKKSVIASKQYKNITVSFITMNPPTYLMQ